MDVAQGLFKVEVFVHFGRGHAHVAAGGQAPVGLFNVGAADDFAEAGHVLHLGFGKALLQPDHLAVGVGAGLELLHGGVAGLVQLLEAFVDGAAVEQVRSGLDGDVFISLAFVLAQLRGQGLRLLCAAGGQFVEQVDLLDQALGRFGVFVKALAQLDLGVVVVAGFGCRCRCWIWRRWPPPFGQTPAGQRPGWLGRS